jgi:hypothetical protein
MSPQERKMSSKLFGYMLRGVFSTNAEATTVLVLVII